MGPGAPFGGRLAAGLLVTSYGIGRLAVTAKNDVLVACLALAAFTAWRRARSYGGVLLAGCLLGSALATKYTAMLSVATLVAVILAVRLDTTTRWHPAAELAWLAAGIVAGYAPW